MKTAIGNSNVGATEKEAVPENVRRTNRMLEDQRSTGNRGNVTKPMLLWALGVPFSIVLLLWLFFFRGRP